MSVSDSCPVQVTKADRDDDEAHEAEAVRLAYDGLGRRLVRERVEEGHDEDHDEATRIEYLFDGLDPVAEYDVERGSWRYDDRGALGRIVSSRRGSAEAFLGSLSEGHEALALQVWYLYDGLGSVVGLTDGGGRLLERRRYAPYGRLLGEGELHQSPYAFVGKAWEEELGLYYFGVRHYDPGVGVWLTQEPLPGERWRPRTWHRYGYAFANPVNYYDLYGMKVPIGAGNGVWSPPPSPPWTPTPTPQTTRIPQGAASPTCLFPSWETLRRRLRYYAGYLIGPSIPESRVEIFTDPNNPYDLTPWLLEQMRSNATGPLGQQLRAYYPWPGAWIGWLRSVKAGAVWDFKPDLLRRDMKDLVLSDEWYAYDVPANIHYGYVGRSIGFSEKVLLFFAGAAQVMDQAVKPFASKLIETKSLRQAWKAIHWKNIGPPETFFDEPGDAAAIRVGMDLYEQYRYDITPERLGEVLRRYEDQLHKGAPQP